MSCHVIPTLGLLATLFLSGCHRGHPQEGWREVGDLADLRPGGEAAHPRNL